MPFPDYEMTAMSMTQYKNYSDMMKAKLPTELQEIILDYVFEDTRKQTHAFKLNLNYNMRHMARDYLDTLKIIINNTGVVHYIRWSDELLEKTKCCVCKKIRNIFSKVPCLVYQYENDDDIVTWSCEVCKKCSDIYDLRIMEDELGRDRFVEYVEALSDAKSVLERDEIYHATCYRSDEDDE